MTIVRILIALATLIATAPGATLFYEDFEGPGVVNVLNQTSGVIAGTQFQIVSGSIDVLTPSDSYTSLCASPASGTCIDTTGGGSGGPGSIESIDLIFFSPGYYAISFVLNGWFYPEGSIAETATVQASIGSLWSDTIVRSGSANPYPVYRAVFLVDSPTLARIQFTTIAGVAYAGAILDDVQVETTTPEPGTFALMGAALVGLAFLRRKAAGKA